MSCPEPRGTDERYRKRPNAPIPTHQSRLAGSNARRRSGGRCTTPLACGGHTRRSSKLQARTRLLARRGALAVGAENAVAAYAASPGRGWAHAHAVCGKAARVGSASTMSVPGRNHRRRSSRGARSLFFHPAVERGIVAGRDVDSFMGCGGG